MNIADLNLESLQSLIDAAVFTLIWLVQLVIYPSFANIDANKLIHWHGIYTFRVSFLIIPLMFAQLGLAVYFALNNPTFSSLSILVLIVSCWILTFVLSVPLHNKIQSGDADSNTLKKLVTTNWPRTILWSLIFIFGL